MKKVTMIVLCCLSFLIGCKRQESSAYTMDIFKHITLAELDEKIVNHEDMVVYFGWTKNCLDSVNFQNNYLLKKVDESSKFKDILVVDLDTELPSGLLDKDARAPLIEKYDVEFSPTIVFYKGGKLYKLLAWTPATTDKLTGILQADLDAFFKEIGFLQEGNGEGSLGH